MSLWTDPSALALQESLIGRYSLERELGRGGMAVVSIRRRIRELRERLAARHEAGVTALERIRLLLARLGSATAPVGEFTAQLEDARGVERSLLTELGAHADLIKILKRGIRSTTLTPTPQSPPQ